MSARGQRLIATLMTLVVSATTVGLPVAAPLEDLTAGACGRRAGCRCSLSKVLSGTCCCSKGAGSCCAAPPPPAETKPLPPCCAARVAQAATAAATETPGDGSERTASQDPAAASDGPQLGCDCGPQSPIDLVVLTDPRLPGARTQWTGERSREAFRSPCDEGGCYDRAAPDAPPPRLSMVA